MKFSHSEAKNEEDEEGSPSYDSDQHTIWGTLRGRAPDDLQSEGDQEKSDGDHDSGAGEVVFVCT